MKKSLEKKRNPEKKKKLNILVKGVIKIPAAGSKNLRSEEWLRGFLSLIKDTEKSRLDIFCYDEKEVPGLDVILRKEFKFFIVRTDKDSILAFKTGEDSEVKDIMEKLEKFYGFEWAGEPLIYDIEKKGGL